MQRTARSKGALDIVGRSSHVNTNRMRKFTNQVPKDRPRKEVKERIDRKEMALIANQICTVSDPFFCIRIIQKPLHALVRHDSHRSKIGMPLKPNFRQAFKRGLKAELLRNQTLLLHRVPQPRAQQQYILPLFNRRRDNFFLDECGLSPARLRTDKYSILV